MSHIFCWTPGVRALLMPKRAPMGRISSTAVQISTGLWVAKLQRMGLAGPKWRSRKQVWRWEGCCRRLSPLPWGEGGESSEPGEGLLWCLHRIAIERGGDPSPVPRPDEVHRDRGTPSPQGRGPGVSTFYASAAWVRARSVSGKPRDWGFSGWSTISWRSRVTRSRQEGRWALRRHRGRA